MSKRNLSEKIKLQSYNDMFGEDENTEIVVQEQIKDVALSELYTFKNHIEGKGADPLFETKCRMEKTPFVKLLCRKHNPYDPKKRQQARKLGKQGKKKDESKASYYGYLADYGGLQN